MKLCETGLDTVGGHPHEDKVHLVPQRLHHDIDHLKIALVLKRTDPADARSTPDIAL